MSDPQVSETPSTNGVATPDATTPAATGGKKAKEVTLLDKIHDVWVKNGKKVPDAETTYSLVDAYEAASNEVKAAEEILKAASEKADKAAYALVLAHGRHIKVNLSDGIHVASCYGEKVYLKRASIIEHVVIGRRPEPTPEAPKQAPAANTPQNQKGANKR